MSTCDAVMQQLERLGTPATRRMYLTHGAPEPLFGVKVADLKKVLKGHQGDHALALELYATGNSDAMYLAGLMADPSIVTRRELERWVKDARWGLIVDYTVPWVAGESPHGWDLGRKWIASKDDRIASAGWSTLGVVVTLRPDDELDLPALEALLGTVEKSVHGAPNRVRQPMNRFVIAVGSAVKPLHAKAVAAAKRIGAIQVDMGGTACKVPLAADYIGKVKAAGKLGKKRKSARC